MINNTKAIAAFIGIVFLAISINGCRQPVCCGSESEEYRLQAQYLETLKRQYVINLFIEYQAQQNTQKVASLFTQDIRDQMNQSQVQEKKRSEVELANYIKGMKAFVFFNEKKSTQKNKAMWALSYQHKQRKGQFLVYYLIKEGDDYKIFKQRSLIK